MRITASLIVLLSLLVPRLVSAQQPRQGLAVIVGVGDYVFLPDIPGVRPTVERWEDFFDSQSIEVRTVLLDENASRESIEAAASSAAGAVRSDDELWFVFVGHGTPSLVDPGGALVGMDAQPSELSLRARSVGQSALLRTLESGRQRGTVLVIDACFSGRTPAGEPLALGEQPVVAVSKPTLRRETTVVMTAAAANETTGSANGRPAYSTYLLDGLAGRADRSGDGMVTAGEATQYVGRLLRRTGRIQTPQLLGGGTTSLAVVVPEAEPVAIVAPPAPSPRVDSFVSSAPPKGGKRMPLGAVAVGYGVAAMYGGIAYYVGNGVAERNAEYDRAVEIGTVEPDDKRETAAAAYFMGGLSAFFFTITTAAIIKNFAERRQHVSLFGSDRSIGVAWTMRF